MERKHTFIVNASYNHETNVTGIGVALHQADKPRRKNQMAHQLARQARCFENPFYREALDSIFFNKNHED